MSREAKVQIKKVKPYPFKVTVTADRPHEGQIVKLTQTGFMMNTGPDFLHVGGKGVASFILPLATAPLQVNVVVVKTWDHYGAAVAGHVAGQNLAELHFKGMDAGVLAQITQFLVRIGQIKS